MVSATKQIEIMVNLLSTKLYYSTMQVSYMRITFFCFDFWHQIHG